MVTERDSLLHLTSLYNPAYKPLGKATTLHTAIRLFSIRLCTPSRYTHSSRPHYNCQGTLTERGNLLQLTSLYYAAYRPLVKTFNHTES